MPEDRIVEEVHSLVLAKGIAVHNGHHPPRHGDLRFVEPSHFKDPDTDGRRDPEDDIWEFVVLHTPSGRLFRQRIEYAADGSTGRSSSPVEVVAQERIVVEYVPKPLPQGAMD